MCIKVNQVLGSAILAIFGMSAQAETNYPLRLENCGQAVTFEQAPENAVALGQNSAEIMLLFGLEDQMAASAFWPRAVLPQVAEANVRVELLTVEWCAG